MRRLNQIRAIGIALVGTWFGISWACCVFSRARARGMPVWEQTEPAATATTGHGGVRTVFFANGVCGSDPALPMVQLSRALGVTALQPGGYCRGVLLARPDHAQVVSAR